MFPTIRVLSEKDDIDAITNLVHEAYAAHAKAGLRYWGTHQTPEDTRTRFASGKGVVMLENDTYIGTAIIRPPQPESQVELYRESNVWSLAQFCVSPKYKGFGYGKLLHSYVLSLATQAGASFIALDTAAPAKALISMYQAWGYEVVGCCDWRPHTNYVSVLMRQFIGGAGPHAR